MARQELYQLAVVQIAEASFPFELPKFDKPFLKDQWSSSRYALFRLLQNEELWEDDKDGPLQLAIDRHHTLNKWPEVMVSLSHSAKWGAAIISSNKDIYSIGVDIELSSREIKPTIKKYYQHPCDNVLERSEMELWVAKEAAFKAVYPLWKRVKTLVLTDLWVQGNSFGLDKQALGEIYWPEDYEDLTVAIALLMEPIG